MSTKDSNKKYPWTVKRGAALIGVILLVGMVVATLIAAIFESPGSNLFRTLLGLDITIPIMLWIVIYAADHMPGKRHGVYEEEDNTASPEKEDESKS